MSSRRVTVRERIDPAITASLFANYRSSADAVMELVDNAIDSRLKGAPLEVLLHVQTSSFAIETRGGEGMGPGELERNYLRWGGSAKRNRSQLGQYGQGGKAAIGHLGAAFSVEASRPGDEMAWRFVDPNYRDRTKLKTYELTVVPKRVATDQGYVRIRVDGVDKRLDTRRLKARLADTYRPLLVRGELKISINGVRAEAPAIYFQEEHRFAVRAAGTTISGWFGTAEPEARGVDYVPGLRCYKLGRLIVSGEYFGHPNAVQVSGMARLIGEVDLAPVPLTMNKSDFVRDGPEWIAIEKRMNAVLAPITKLLAEDELAPPPASAVKTAEQVRRLLGQVLKLAEREGVFPGMSTSRAAAEPRESVATHGARQDEGPRAPARPAAENEARRHGFGQVVVRPLDATIRSQTLIKNDITTIVINSRHPLFLKRGGDIWYQLETAAREVFKSLEGASVAEFERRVNEVVLLAFKLRAKRRDARTRKSARQLRLIEE
ncbi:MAG: ATP-binding protein [Candidatus Dormibacteraceae bacterium]